MTSHGNTLEWHLSSRCLLQATAFAVFDSWHSLHLTSKMSRNFRFFYQHFHMLCFIVHVDAIYMQREWVDYAGESGWCFWMWDDAEVRKLRRMESIIDNRSRRSDIQQLHKFYHYFPAPCHPFSLYIYCQCSSFNMKAVHFFSLDLVACWNG